MTVTDDTQGMDTNDVEDKDIVVLEFDEIDEIDPLADLDDEEVRLRQTTTPSPRKIRKNIEDILAERALNRKLSDIFDDELLD